jgi:hypothetical protein
MLSIILAKCTLVCIKCTFPPLKMKAKPNCTPPFLLPVTHPPMHGDVSPVLGASISVLNLALKWGESISLGEVLYSAKWVKYSALPQAITQNTTKRHNNQHVPPPPYPPAALAHYCHGSIHHGPTSWRFCSLLVCSRRGASGALSPLPAPLIGAPKQDPLKNREMVGAWALGGCR